MPRTFYLGPGCIICVPDCGYADTLRLWPEVEIFQQVVLLYRVLKTLFFIFLPTAPMTRDLCVEET